MATTPNQQRDTASLNGHGPIAQQLAALQSKNHQDTQHNKRGWSVWTGFSHKTLWDWLQLVAALAIPLAIAAGTTWFSYQQSQTSLQISGQQRQADLHAATDQQQETALQTYLDHMSDLLLTDKLRTSKEGDEVRQVARARTLTTLRRLDSKRKGALLQFLQEAGLISVGKVVINLDGADLSSADLDGANLHGAKLSNNKLIQADLSYANLSYANLSYADLSNADLNGATLIGAHL
jgi:hypothetical protein